MSQKHDEMPSMLALLWKINDAGRYRVVLYATNVIKCSVGWHYCGEYIINWPIGLSNESET